MTPTVTIDTEHCRDAKVVGAKAARLAQAKAAGLPVPQSVAVPCAVSADVIASAMRDADSRGLHACRLNVMAADRSALGDLVALARRIGPALAVRSSAPLEGDPGLAGAYSSLIGVSPEEVPTAVLAVWASAIRGQGSPPRMGVLIQPELAPTWAGTAERAPDGSVQVVATKGSAEALTAGWAAGVTATVSPSGDITLAASADTDGSVLRAAAALARDVAAALGDNLIEWAYADGRSWLIQSRSAAQPRPSVAQTTVDLGTAPSESRLERPVVLRAVRCAGDLAERWILPWAIAWGGRPCPDKQCPPRLLERPSAAWELMTDLSTTLTSRVWAVRPSETGQVAAELGSLQHWGSSLLDERLQALRRPDPRLARRCMQLCASLAAHLIAARVITSARHFWALPADLGLVLRSGAAPPDPHRAAHQAALRWEPLLYSAVATGTRFSGVPASPGMGCGPAMLADDAAFLIEHHVGGLPARSVIVARYPLPQYSPLLMGAAGLVARGGSGAAHLLTVARSLGVPAVLGCDLSSLLRPGAQAYVAVDGNAGTAAVLDMQ